MAREKIILPNTNQYVGGDGQITAITIANTYTTGAKVTIYVPYTIYYSSYPSTIQFNLQNVITGNATIYASAATSSIPASGSSGVLSTTITLGANKTIPAGQVFASLNHSGGTVTGLSWTANSAYVILGNAPAVVAGDPIKKTDFDLVFQSATVNSAISNSNFTKNTTITASAWNTKWGLPI